MEDVVMSTYDEPRPCPVGGKRSLIPDSTMNDSYLLPEKRQVNNMTIIPSNKTIGAKQQPERGEKRSASELNLQDPQTQPQQPREPTPGELEEREICKRIAARVMAFPINDSNIRTCFHGINEPGIPFPQYVERLVHYANVWAREKPNVNSQGVRCAVLAVEYLERANVRVCGKSIHRLFLIAFLIGIKLTDDFGMSNTFWGRAGGCSLEDVNRMEIEFCNMLRWEFGVLPETYEKQKCRFVAC